MRRVFVVMLCCLLMACSSGGERASTERPDMSAGPDENAMGEMDVEPDPRPPEMAEALPPPPPPPPPPPTYRDGASEDTDIVPTSARRSARRAERDSAAAAGAADSQESAADEPDEWIKPGKGAFRQPPPMLVGAASRLTFAVGANEAAVGAALGNRPATEASDISISPVMQVDLVPDGNFDFLARSDARQEIGADQRATWHWDVTPKRRGNFTLTAKVQVFRNGRAVDAYDSYVDVRVRVGRKEAVKEEIGFLKMIGDELKGLFSTWEGTFTALGLMLIAAFGVWKVMKTRGAKT